MPRSHKHMITDAVTSLRRFDDLLRNPSLWHKFNVYETDTLDRNQILKAVLDFVRPADMIPVNFERQGNYIHFLARNCEKAIERLYDARLRIANPHSPDRTFKITIELQYSDTDDLKIDASQNIKKILRKRYTLKGSTLDLKAFCDDPDLLEYCPLSQPKLLSYVLHLARPLRPLMVNLSHNDLWTLVPLESVDTMPIEVLDLSHNALERASDLQPLRHLKLLEIFLEGNPLCDLYEDEQSYVQRIREWCSHLQRIDGTTLRVQGFPAFRRNFLCNNNGYDLVDQFLEKYFNIVDLKKKDALMKMYSQYAMMSLSAEYIPCQNAVAIPQMKRYPQFSRNILHIVDLSRSDHNLHMGPKAIAEFILNLPIAEHDPYSFTVDLIYYTDKCASIVVCGVLRERMESLMEAERLLGFNRHFVLLAQRNQYIIINDHLHIYNALSSQQTRAFKIDKPPRPQLLPAAETSAQKAEAVHAFKTITHMTTEWSKKYLEERQYNLTGALKLLVERLSQNLVPEEAFTIDQKKSNN